VDTKIDGNVAGSRSAARQAACATSIATTTLSGARRRSLAASSDGAGRFGASDTAGAPSAAAWAAAQPGSPEAQKPTPAMRADRRVIARVLSR
jgi:hypothetical protein